MAHRFGDRVAQARRELGVRLRRDITPAELAAMVGVSTATVYRWESSEKLPRDEGNMAKLADVLGVTPAYLRYGVRDAPIGSFTPVAPPAAKKKRGA